MSARIVNIGIGLFLLAAPELLGYEGPARVSHVIIGPLAASVAVMAISQVLRELRWLNALLGGWLVLSPLFVPHDQTALVVGIASGIGMALLALVRGPATQRLGGGWPAVLDPEEVHR